MKKTAMFACLVVCVSFFMASCRSASEIPYTVMHRYFQSNKVKELPSATVTTESDFQRLFGAAAVMGKNGLPTPVDFSKEYVIAVSKPETNVETTLSPVSLKRNANGEVEFTYKVKTGESMSYSIVPCLLIKVSRDVQGPVVLKEE